MRRFERPLVVLGVLLLVALPTAVHGWPTTARGNVSLVLLLSGGFALLWWRRPRVASVGALGLFLASVVVDGWAPDSAVALYSASFAVLALGWSGRAAWLVALCGLAYLAVFAAVSGETSWVAALMFTVPPYAAGTALRQRRETSELLALRARELEEERELFTQIAVRHERARIAGELHDVVGHAVSVMVIQAAAGQRLVDTDPGRARAAFTAISESARQGTKDLERLVELLGTSDVSSGVGEGGRSDLALVDEVVARAGRSGLNVTCRFEGDRDRVSPPVAHLAYRLVQESLTNALRHAPGADVRVTIRVEEPGRRIAVRVENDHAEQVGETLSGTGRGLVGLAERVRALGGTYAAGPTGAGGWAVDARLPLG